MKIRQSIERILGLIARSARNWSSDQGSTIGAALAFYCAFSLAPLLVLVVALVGAIVGTELAYGYVASQLTALFGKGSAETLIAAVRSAQSSSGMLAAIVSIVSLLVGATSVFAALENALEQIWGASPCESEGWRGFVRTRLLSLGFILAIGFLLLVSLSITTALSALRSYVSQRFTGVVAFISVGDFLVSVAMSTLLVALIYRYMPRRRLGWKTVTRGALVTALLFQLGRWAIGLYLGKATQPSAFGAAASFVALLLWLYYSAQIFLFGAEFTACLGDLRNPATRSSPPKRKARGAPA